MDALAGLTFRDTRFLWLLALAPAVLAWLLWRERLRMEGARRLVAERLRGNSNGIRFLRPWLLTVAFVALTVSLAGPQYGFTLLPVDVAESNRFFIVDVSSSMDARDTGASRLELARALLQQLVTSADGRVALMVFEKEAAIVSPLTTDTSAVASLLETVHTGETNAPGSDLGKAVMSALRSSATVTGEAMDIVLVSDGEDQGRGISTAVDEAKRRGVRIHTIMVGTAAGATIPGADGALRDDDGNEIVTRADASVLRALATGTGGRFFDNPFSTPAIQAMQEEIRSAPGRRNERELRLPTERFEWSLGAGIAALLFAALVHRGAL